MKQVRVAVSRFSLDKFIKKELGFLKKVMNPNVDPSCGIPFVESEGGVPDYGDEKGVRNTKVELMDEHRILFFPFATPITGEKFPCANGRKYIYGEDDEGLCFGEMDMPGFLVKIQPFKKKENEIHIKPAVYCGGGCMFPPPSIDAMKKKMGILDEPMTDFIMGFIK